mmetsp:Transcript_13604/g.58098  ORF Transcript_13604/g.58098 Transcript_13604/m.58098 type:complete len:224 (+) Transcript_13604:2925-3596(+)
MRKSPWSIPTLRSDTNARSFHLLAQTLVKARHAISQRSGVSGGAMPAFSISAWIASMHPAGGTSSSTHSRHARSDNSSACSEESSTARSRACIFAFTAAFKGSSSTCSMVPKGITIDLGSLIQLGMRPPPRLSLSALVLRALAPTTPLSKRERGTVYDPQKGTFSSASFALGAAPAAPAASSAPFAAATAAASEARHATESPATSTAAAAPSMPASCASSSGS